jgi:uncharacterized protein (TIGR02145 family)
MKFIYSILCFCFLSCNYIFSQTIVTIHKSNGEQIDLLLNTIDSVTYTLGVNPYLPTVVTTPVTQLTNVLAVAGGEVLSDATHYVTQRGICWSTSPNPTLNDPHSINGSGLGTFTAQAHNLQSSTTYYIRAYAINSAGVGYGNEISVTTQIEGFELAGVPGDGVTFDGYTYPTLVYANGQEWMAENLKTTIYANGDLVTQIVDLEQWENTNTGKWCYYNFDSQYNNPYGKLYSWESVLDSRNICPTGWRVPTNSDWNTFKNYLGGESLAGGRMKSTGTIHWQSPNTGANNLSGFNALAGGYLSFFPNNSDIYDLRISGNWWSSTLYDSDYVYALYLSYNWSISPENQIHKGDGASIRCIKN